uniref:CHK domain-containing protein n=1 Tax=Steinernema glaseri TaxID=37863 RepID=A0A1I7ZHZ4_9BILA
MNIGGSTLGLLSQVYDIVITFENSDEEYRILMKVPGMESLDALKKRSGKTGILNDSFASEAHMRECAFYRDYAPHLAELPLVDVYVAKEFDGSHGVLLMESLVQKAAVLPIWDTATESQMFAFAKHLSYLYAHFLCLPPETWLGKYPRNYLTYFVTSDFYYLYVDKLCALKPGMFEEAYRVFRPYMGSKKFYDYTMTDVYKDIVLCVDGEIRREYEYQVLQFLYDRIGHLVEERGKSVNFSFDQMKQAYQVNFIPRALQLMIAPAYLLSNDVALDEEAQIVVARREQFFPRIKLAMEDALEYFKQVRKDRIEEKAP